MKTYREMTESVLHKAGTEVLKRERRRRNAVCIAAAGLCFALLVTVLGMGMGKAPIVLPTQPGEQPGISMDANKQTEATVDATNIPPQVETQAKVKITFLSNIEKTVFQGVTLPLDTKIRVRDIRGLSWEEVVKVLEEEKTIADDVLSFGNAYTAVWNYEQMIISITSRGSISLEFDDSTTVSGIDILTTEAGSVIMSSSEKGPRPGGTPEGIYWPNVREVYLDWKPSQEAILKIDEDPTIPLSFINDTITATVHYADETTEILIFDITVNDEGQIFVTQRGIPTEAA